MIEFEKGTITEEEVKDLTKNFIGIRYKYDKNGDFVAYANAWTIIVDLLKKIKR